MEYINWIINNVDTILTVAVSVVGTAALLATVTPTKKDDKFLSQLAGVIHFLAANFGKAKNK